MAQQERQCRRGGERQQPVKVPVERQQCGKVGSSRRRRERCSAPKQVKSRSAVQEVVRPGRKAQERRRRAAHARAETCKWLRRQEGRQAAVAVQACLQLPARLVAVPPPMLDAFIPVVARVCAGRATGARHSAMVGVLRRVYAVARRGLVGA